MTNKKLGLFLAPLIPLTTIGVVEVADVLLRDPIEMVKYEPTPPPTMWVDPPAPAPTPPSMPAPQPAPPQAVESA